VPSAVIDVPSKSHVVSIERERLQLHVAAEEQHYFICSGGAYCWEPAPEELFSVTADGVETTNTRCTVTRVAKFDTCPWGRLSKRPSQRNPWGPGYNIKLQCKEKTGKAFNLVRDWVIEKGSLRLMPVPGYRCLLPHPTKPDLHGLGFTCASTCAVDERLRRALINTDCFGNRWLPQTTRSLFC
jgi:hypothetical protein